MTTREKAFPCDSQATGFHGMDLLDYFAASALSYLQQSLYVNPKMIAEDSYNIADAMMAEREKRHD